MKEEYLLKAAEPAAETNQSLVLSPLQDIKGFLFLHLGRSFLFLVTCVSVLAVLLIFFFVIRQALPFAKMASLTQFLTDTRWQPESEQPGFGALPFIAGSLYVTFLSLLFAVPVGILAAVFLSDIVSFRIRNIIKPVIEILAAIPSVAYGFFAVLVLAPWMQKQLGFSTGTNILNASIILSIMALPTIISVAEDALCAIGTELREASYGLGATRVETVFKVIIPAAHSGIIAAIVLGMMRAIGETMVVWMAAGNARQIPTPWWDLSQSVGTMTAVIAGDMAETPKGSAHFHCLFMIGLLLLLFTFFLNTISEYFLAGAKKKMGKTR
jgi:phosphate transport system permease protein